MAIKNYTTTIDSVKTISEIYDFVELQSKSSIKDIDNFKRELKRDGLYNEELEEFIEQYMIYYNK